MLHVSTSSMCLAIALVAGSATPPARACDQPSAGSLYEGAAFVTPASAQTALKTKSKAKAKAASKAGGSSRTTINTNDGADSYSVALDDDQVVSASINGKPLPPDRIIRDGDVIHLLDEHGQGVHEIHLAGHGDEDAATVFAGPAAPRVRIGVTMDAIGDALAAQLGVDADKVVIITGVLEGGPAEKAGLKVYDVVTEVDGDSPVSDESLREAVQSKDAGDTLRLRVVRKGQPQNIDITVEKYEPQPGDKTPLPRGFSFGSGQNAEEAARAMREWAEAARGMAGEQRAKAAEEIAKARQRLDRARELAHSRLKSDLSEELQKRFADETDKLNLSLDADTKRQIEEALRRAAEELEGFDWDFDFDMPEFELLPGQGDGSGMVLVAPRAPKAPTPPAAPAPPSPRAGGDHFAPPGDPPVARPRSSVRNPEPDDRFKSLEDRLARLERLLEKLVDEKAGPNN